MRIISGKWKGRRFELPKGVAARPTSDRIREAVFSILGGRVSGANILDMFCGSGAVGLEALSRGAARAVFCDSDRKCIARLAETLAAFGQPASEFSLLAHDFRKAVPKLKALGERFDIIYIDPPYKAGYYVEVMETLQELAASGCILLAEHDRRDRLPDRIGNFDKFDERTYGEIRVSFYGGID